METWAITIGDIIIYPEDRKDFYSKIEQNKV
jgi:hypothetical protein